MNTPYAIGVDVGGTFIDCVLYNEKTAKIWIKKVLSTPEDPSIGVFKGIDQLLESTHISMKQVSRLIHGTTLVANAVIERKGAHAGMITTEGFVNVLDMRREWRYDNYDFHLKFPEPLIPAHRRRAVHERIWFNGAVLASLKKQELVNAVRDLVNKEGVESIAICFLHSYANPEHEQVAETLVKNEFPKLHVTSSSAITPYVKEFERFSTTAINAYTLPVINRYLNRLKNGLVAREFGGELFLFYITSCSGGLVNPEIARELPVLLLESGPVAGVRIASYIGTQTGYENILSFDMGGTTAKGCFIKDGQAEKAYQFEVARIHRFKAGSGYPVTIPSIRLVEMGAGGGSIAKVDARGVLRVGPESAGAAPGPACYSLGGQEATVTDADLILGYLNPDYFLGGQLRLDRQKAEMTIQRSIADPLNLSLEKAAYGIYEIVNQNMSQAFRIHAAETGADVRQFDVFAFGGAGPVHAWKVAVNLYSPRVIVPFEAGIASALGLLVTPLAFDFVRTKRMSLSEMTPEHFRDIYEPIIEERLQILKAAGISDEKIQITKTLDMRYRGQGFNIEVKLPREFEPQQDDLKELFEREYKRVYNLTVQDVPIEIYNFKVLVSGPEFEIGLNRESSGKARNPVKDPREAYFGSEIGYQTCTVYDRYLLQPGAIIRGPAIVEEMTTTCIIPPHAAATIDKFHNLVIALR